MSALVASTQYGDNRGTASVTWHEGPGLERFAEAIGVPDDYVPIGLRIKRFFVVNRTDPIEDERETASVFVELLTLSKEDLGAQSIPDYFQSQEPDDICVKRFSKQFNNIDSVLDWFKEIDIVLLTHRLAEMELSGVRVENVPLGETG